MALTSCAGVCIICKVLCKRTKQFLECYHLRLQYDLECAQVPQIIFYGAIRFERREQCICPMYCNNQPTEAVMVRTVVNLLESDGKNGERAPVDTITVKTNHKKKWNAGAKNLLFAVIEENLCRIVREEMEKIMESFM